jgi:hypothetical protein
MRYVFVLLVASCAAQPAKETLDKDGKLVPVYRTDLPHCSEVTLGNPKDKPSYAQECRF